MSKNEVDFIIVGQGLAGSALSIQLIREGKNVLVVDSFNPNSSSQVAAGLVNPITGRRIVKSWMADTLIPFAENFYKSVEEDFNENFYHKMDVLEVIHSVKELNDWTSRMEDSGIRNFFDKNSPENLYSDKINEFLKLIRITSSSWMNIPYFVELCRRKLIESKSLLEESFDHSKLIIENDWVEYKNYRSKKIIFCEGYSALKNPFWKWLPFVPAKGEILLIECHELPEEFILISGIFLIPVGNNKFRVGSTYEWNFTHENPTDEGKSKILDQLNILLKIPFTVLEHRAGIRPTVKDRRPFVGPHPKHKNVLIFNGMGTKGVQLVPYFAHQLIEFLINDGKLPDEVNVKRFY